MRFSVLTLLAALALHGSIALAADGTLPWPDHAYARVEETRSKDGHESKATFRLAFERAGEVRTLRFAGPDSISVDGREAPSDMLPPTEIFQPDLAIAADGTVIGAADREKWRNAMLRYWQLMEQHASGEKQKQLFRSMQTDASVGLVESALPERFSTWMNPWLHRPGPGEEKAEYDSEIALGGVELPYLITTRTEASSQPSELVVVWTGVLDTTGRGQDVMDALQGMASEMQLQPRPSKDGADDLQFERTREIRAVYARDTALPLRVEFTDRAVAKGKRVAEERRAWLFEWSDHAFADPNVSVVFLGESGDVGTAEPEKAGELPPEPTDAEGNRNASMCLVKSPKYPASAIRRKHAGEVLVGARIGADGALLAVRVAKSSGYPELDEAALETVRGWTFHHALERGKPVEREIEVPVKFTLGEL
ncbi:MAG TPA: energy transducer TonB [Xanthomonadales bacterium]|nr:energy transducer TonB [Xanthomonadales bacterium]